MPTPEEAARFANDLQQFATEIDIDLGILTKRVVLQIFTGIILKTPVDTGRLESNWAINVAGPAPAPSHAIKGDVKGDKRSKASVNAEALNYAAAAVNAVDGKQVVYITNNLPYASYVEHGTDRNAPVGMVARTLAEIQEDLSAILSG